MRTREAMQAAGLNPIAVMEVFPARDGLLCGMQEVIALLREVLPPDREVWALTEGDGISAKEVVLRIKARYLSYAVYETAILGMLASETGWATAAAECVAAAGSIPVVSFGASCPPERGAISRLRRDDRRLLRLLHDLRRSALRHRALGDNAPCHGPLL